MWCLASGELMPLNELAVRLWSVKIVKAKTKHTTIGGGNKSRNETLIFREELDQC